MLVPSLFRGVERTRVGIALGFVVKDRVDSRGAITDSDHNSVLIRTHDVGNAIQHGILL